MAMFRRYISNFDLVVLIISLLVQSSVGNELNGSGQRPKYYPSQEGSTFDNGAGGRNRPLFGEGQLCPRNSPSGCYCWARPDFPSQHIFVNCTGTNKDIVPQVDFHCIPLNGSLSRIYTNGIITSLLISGRSSISRNTDP